MNRPAGAGLRARAAGAQVVLRTDGRAAARIVVTVVAAWQVALWLGADQPPVFAAVVPLVALRGDPFTALGASVQRVLGVVAGVVIAIVALATGPAAAGDNLARARGHLPALGVATAAAIGDSLAAGGGHDGLPGLTTARTALAAYARADSSAVAGVLRRPFRRILDDLDPAQGGGEDGGAGGPGAPAVRR
ncbi:hypothetical protein PV721_24335 [Streptomyces sp. MB09-01]|uniref:hypothetical protein n=1 Tax=Streptomyces sp. MB09-01 TaxID=3028666 RepID=UPI0029B477F8|nr:hypothetical protein [Streptomyces sp. MB09-01]MDX3537441.1 hypothetical protein [Streptomyces sp. MB09-01]